MTSSLPQGQVTIERLCRLARVSRAGYYRFWQASAPRQHDTAARHDPAAGADQWPLSSRRPLHHPAAAPRRPDRQPQARVAPDARGQPAGSAPAAVCAADDRSAAVVPNLARDMQLSALDQLWVADITDIRLQEEFAYLAVIRDAFSRRAIGWAMADHLGASLAVAALAMALAARRPSWGSLVHHSDRGVQYACAEYTHLLEAHGIAASMSRVGNPYDNAKVERFIRTLKSEEIDGTLYRDHRDAAGHIGAFIDQVYNRQRLHSALGYQTPVAFEAEHRARSLVTASLTTVGFQGIRKSTVMPDAQPTPSVATPPSIARRRRPHHREFPT